MSVIEDGKGTGKKAGVNSINRLNISSKTENRIFYISRDNKKAFSVYGKRNFTAGSTNENILYLKYIGDNTLFIKDMMFSSNSSAAKIEVYFAPVGVSGGTSIVPLNMNRGSVLESETTCLHGETDLTATVVDAKEFYDVRLNNSSFHFDFHGAVMLPKNSSILVLGEVATAGDKIRTMIYFYESD